MSKIKFTGKSRRDEWGIYYEFTVEDSTGISYGEQVERFDHQCVDGPGTGGRPMYDAQRIYLTRACDRCEKHKLSQYEPWVISGYDQNDIDEPIEAE